jgi:hypothetical protein
MTNLIYAGACMPVSAPAHHANVLVYARARNNCVSIVRNAVLGINLAREGEISAQGSHEKSLSTSQARNKVACSGLLLELRMHRDNQETEAHWSRCTFSSFTSKKQASCPACGVFPKRRRKGTRGSTSTRLAIFVLNSLYWW